MTFAEHRGIAMLLSLDTLLTVWNLMSRGVTGLYSYPEKLHACRHEMDTSISDTPFMEIYSIFDLFFYFVSTAANQEYLTDIYWNTVCKSNIKNLIKIRNILKEVKVCILYDTFLMIIQTILVNYISILFIKKYYLYISTVCH